VNKKKSGAKLVSGIVGKKLQIRQILYARDTIQLKNFAQNNRNPLRILTSLLFDNDPLTRWRAIEAIGIVSAIIAGDDLESVRRQVRRFFWMMNDESGNFCRYAPEAIGEMLANVPVLIPEYAQMLSAFLVEEPFERGARIAIARVAEIDRNAFGKPTMKKLAQTLNDPEPYIRGSSILALKAAGVYEAIERVKPLLADKNEIEIYDFNTGDLKRVPISEIAAEFISQAEPEN
jgi:HEAT repeat protein